MTWAPIVAPLGSLCGATRPGGGSDCAGRHTVRHSPISLASSAGCSGCPVCSAHSAAGHGTSPTPRPRFLCSTPPRPSPRSLTSTRMAPGEPWRSPQTASRRRWAGGTNPSPRTSTTNTSPGRSCPALAIARGSAGSSGHPVDPALGFLTAEGIVIAGGSTGNHRGRIRWSPESFARCGLRKRSRPPRRSASTKPRSGSARAMAPSGSCSPPSDAPRLCRRRSRQRGSRASTHVSSPGGSARPVKSLVVVYPFRDLSIRGQAASSGGMGSAPSRRVWSSLTGV